MLSDVMRDAAFASRSANRDVTMTSCFTHDCVSGLRHVLPTRRYVVNHLSVAGQSSRWWRTGSSHCLSCRA